METRIQLQILNACFSFRMYVFPVLLKWIAKSNAIQWVFYEKKLKL